MNDLISRNKLQQNRPEWLNENCVGREEHNKGWNACNEMWLKTIAEQPTVEAVPVVHGEWIETERELKYPEEWGGGSDIEEYTYCNHCGYENEEVTTHNFCPNCGADMRKKV